MTTTTTIDRDTAIAIAANLNELEKQIRLFGDGTHSNTYVEDAEAREGIRAEIEDMANGLAMTLDKQSYLWPATGQGQKYGTLFLFVSRRLCRDRYGTGAYSAGKLLERAGHASSMATNCRLPFSSR